MLPVNDEVTLNKYKYVKKQTIYHISWKYDCQKIISVGFNRFKLRVCGSQDKCLRPLSYDDNSISIDWKQFYKIFTKKYCDIVSQKV